ncbi:unnamed protein product [Dovyalis caffra]|uniref:dolichol kinase n=1 Tax=Dovyalis caffra TaxID=77055 RepID=A0AAV1RBE4_9ROSI|nr:unnamed protein product [Dovyalis caffra]
MAVTSSQLFNGERAVVTLFVVIVLFSLPLSLLMHGVLLSLLALFALYVEIRLETSASFSQFKARAGASSGILLGAVTLPTFMLSKLIQQSRALSLHQIQAGALFFFYSATGVHAIWKLLWVLFHGFTAVKLVQHLLNTFPSCASIGEALLVTVGLVLYFGDMLAYTIEKASAFLCKTVSSSLWIKPRNSKIERILLRKYYHLMAVSMFLPAVILQPKFLDLAFGAALAVFLTLEIIRVWRIWPLGQLVHEFMNAFTDHRDSDLLIVRHD